jgi:hypothetical protein
MKTSKTTIILGVALMVVAGFFTATVTGLLSVQATQVAKTSGGIAGAYMSGHVTTILTDSQGIVKEYRQSDNVITNVGENCVAKLLFQDDGTGAGLGSGTGTSACTGSLNEPWSVIAIGTSTTKANGTNVVLGSELAGSGLTRAKATSYTWTNSSGTAGNSAATVVLAKTFTNTGSSVQVAESGLFNSTTAAGSGLFARQNFTAIGLGNGDSLTVQWTINIGGTQFNLAQ